MDSPTREPREPTQRQRATIKRLERALAAVHAAGLLVVGMDDTLTAYRRDDVEALEADGQDLYDALRALIAADTHLDVDDHGAYRESGGW